MTTTLWNLADVTKFTRLSQRTIWSLCKPRGDLPCLKVGRRLLFVPSDVMAFFERQAVAQNVAEHAAAFEASE